MKNGFTLIELLAVIVILAVIAIIAVPIIINIIDDARKNAALQSANGYVRAVNYKIAQEVLNNREVNEEEEYIIGENELALTGNNLDDITGSYILSNSRVLFAGLCVNNYSIEYNATTGKTVFSTASNYCTGDAVPEYIEPEGVYVSAVCTDSTLYTDTTVFKIKTVEDLVCFSNLVDSGNSFSGKTVHLVSDIDFNSDNSYSNPNATTYGDINGDSTTSGLKTEVTTGAGFQPIGAPSSQSGFPTIFQGTFQGNAFTIFNLMINRPLEDNVGLFSEHFGLINGLKIRSASVIGKGNVGIVSGKSGGSSNNVTLKNLDIQGSVEGLGNNIGGISGYAASGGKVEGFIFKGTVVGNNNVGGVFGYSSNSNNYAKGIIYDTTITSTETTVGIVATTNFNDYVFIKNVTKSPANSNGYNGTVFTTGDIAFYDETLDTYIGGDTDGDHYYFDYDSDGIMTLYSTERNPIQLSKLKGSGTEESPYLIKNVKDWKLASATIDGTNSYYYSLTSDIDFTNKVFYPLGSKTNTFKGTFDGGYHTLSNIDIHGYSYVGVFGRFDGTLKDTNFNNLTIIGMNDYVGILGNSVGSNNNGHYIKGIKVRNTTITGNDYVGTISGQHGGGSSSGSSINNLDIQSTVTGRNNVGGLMGWSGSWAKIEDFVYTGTVSGNNNVAGVLGYSGNSNNYSKGMVYNTTVTVTGTQAGIVGNTNFGGTTFVKNSTKNTTNTNSNDGIAYTVGDIALYDSVLDTYVGGDTNGDNYYFDLDSSGIITLYNTDERPITNTLAGTGTENDPYIIASTDDWKMASATVNEADTMYYSVTSDLDFTNKVFYPLGSYNNPLKGTVNGNHHTLSNVNIHGYDYVGVIGKFEGTFKDFNFNNLTIAGISNYVGILGSSKHYISGIKVRNATISGYNYVGTLSGTHSGGASYSTINIRNIDIQSNVTGNNNVAGLFGGSGSWVKVADYAFKGTVTGVSNVAGVMGSSGNGYNGATGVIYDSTMTSANTSVGIVGNANFTGGTTYVYNTTKSPDNSNGYNGTAISSKTLEAVASVIDTTDSNGDGYSFTLTNGDYELVYSN